MKFAKDEHGTPIICWTPREGVALTTTFIPEKNEVYKLASDVTITIDSIAVDYDAGTEVCFAKGLTYTLSVATNAHKM